MKRIIFVILVFVGLANISYAQFTIKEKKNVQAQLDTVSKSSIKNFEIDANTPAYRRFLRKQRWHEKNFFETINSLTFTQHGYHNWPNGENTFNGMISTQTSYVHQAEKMVLVSFFNASYSLGQSDGELNKLADNLQFNTEIGYALYKQWSYTLGLNLTSQFTKTYNNDVTRDTYSSNFFAPANLKPYIGFTYSQNTQRKITISPLSGNMLFVLDDSLSNAGAFGVDVGKKFKLTGGAFVNAQWDFNLVKNGLVKYRTVFQGFWDYKTAPDYTWEHWIDIAFLKMFTVNFYVRAVYDEDIIVMVDGPDGTEVPSGSFLQIRQSLGFGIKYQFRNKSRPSYKIVK